MEELLPLSFDAYLNTLPAERRESVETVWQLVRQCMPEGYEERVGPKFLEYRIGPDVYVALANQKNYISLYLVPVYVDPNLRQQLDAVADKKLKVGKSCLNFLQADQLPLPVIGQIIGAMPPAAFQERIRQNRGAHR